METQISNCVTVTARESVSEFVVLPRDVSCRDQDIELCSQNKEPAKILVSRTTQRFSTNPCNRSIIVFPLPLATVRLKR